ncbi:D-alanine--D-alanine ligase [Patescibacteria group bacterium]|nr:MAG: D-alanine--D-alanine ligase [Patescibacteria group bacterium]
MKKKLNIGLIFGGRSGEHEVSLKSAKEVMNSLDSEKYNVIPLAITKTGKWLLGEKGNEYMTLNLPQAGQAGGVAVGEPRNLIATEKSSGLTQFSEGESDFKLDIVLPIGHGNFMEDGKLQGMLDMLGLPYVFSGTLTSALAMNKQKTKLIAKSVGLKIAKEFSVYRGKKYNRDKIIQKLGLPIVVKPVESGSSVGMSICREAEKLEQAISKAFEYSREVMLEQFIQGRELTVAVMGNDHPKALPVIEIIPKIADFFSYEAKYQAGGSEEICPADIPEEVRRKVQRYAINIFKALGCQDLARADFIWNENDNKLYFLEINTIPGMTSASLAPKAAKAAGMTFPQFLDKLIRFAINRQAE